MRTLLLALMIVLLPVRGWLGDAMAVGMAGHAMSGAAPLAAKASAAMEAGLHCHDAVDAGDDMASMGATMDGAAHGGMAAAHEAPQGHAGQLDHGDDGDSHGSGVGHQGCGTCTVCQVCHTVALGGMPGAAIVHDAPQAAPSFHEARFASAEPVPGLKPPIS